MKGISFKEVRQAHRRRLNVPRGKETENNIWGSGRRMESGKGSSFILLSRAIIMIQCRGLLSVSDLLCPTGAFALFIGM
jgi:hypothetical protein